MEKKKGTKGRKTKEKGIYYIGILNKSLTNINRTFNYISIK